MANQIKGELIVLSVYDVTGTIYRPVACLTSNSLSQTRGIIESQTKCDPGLTIKAAGSMSYNVSLEGNYIDTTSAGSEVTSASHDYLKKEFMDTGIALTWRMDTGLTDTPFYYGTGILSDLEMTAPAGEEFVTFTGAIEGSGAIVEEDPNEAP